MSEYANDVLEKYKLDKRYNFITAIALSGVLLILIFLLVYVAIPLAMQQALIAIIGMVSLTTLEAFKRCLEDKNLSQNITIVDNRVIENNTVYKTSYERQNLKEAAAEIQELLEHLSKSYPTETEKEQIELAVEVADEIKNNPPLKSRLIAALKAGGMEALKQSINHPLSNMIVTVLAAYSQGWEESSADNAEVEEKTANK
jgi:hypothetical protein